VEKPRLPVHRLHHTRSSSTPYTAELDACAGSEPPARQSQMAATQTPQTVRRVRTVITLVAWTGPSRAWPGFCANAAPDPPRCHLAHSSIASFHWITCPAIPSRLLADGMTKRSSGGSRRSSLRSSRHIIDAVQDTHSSVPEIARELNVQAVSRLGDSLRRSDSHHRQLIQGIPMCTSVRHLRSEFRDVLALDSEVAQSIARQIEVPSPGRSAAGWSQSAVSPRFTRVTSRPLRPAQEQPSRVQRSHRAFREASIASRLRSSLRGLGGANSKLEYLLWGFPFEVRPKVLAAPGKR